MSNYEFWNDLGKIFNAVVAYQEKSMEFNKRFINPWIRLGNVFDKQDRSSEAINAYKIAIELDPANAQNWYELGNAYFQAEAYEDAVEAYNKAIGLQSDSGWAYNNLAFTLVKQGKYAEAIPLYLTSIDRLRDDRDKAVAWNRLGNAYRKLNEYECALDAFQKADEFDEENAGFRDELDDVSDGPTLIEGDNSDTSSEATEAMASSNQPSVSDSLMKDPAPANDLEKTIPSAADSTSKTLLVEVPSSPSVSESTNESQSNILASVAENSQGDTRDAAGDVTGEISAAADLEDETAVDSSQGTDQATAEVIAVSDAVDPENATSDATQPGIVEGVQSTDLAVEPCNELKASEAVDEQTLTIIVQNIVQTYTDSQVVGETVTQTSAVDITTVSTDSKSVSEVEEPATEDAERDPLYMETEPTATTLDAEIDAEADIEDGAESPATGLEIREEAEQLTSQEVETVEETVETSAQATDDNVPPAHAAYEEFLKDNGDNLHILVAEATEVDIENRDSGASQEPVTKIDASGEVQIEVDTKNARVWNELGNVYFNTDAYDDAIAAYRKAIELDRQFAWPYSNLALTYVQKGRFVEAILLYQRSIELFSSEKDKAISWNRLGNVYRRLNDYENAISAYQQADELDSDNTTLSMQSRFSLLGNYFTDSKSSYVG